MVYYILCQSPTKYIPVQCLNLEFVLYIMVGITIFITLEVFSFVNFLMCIIFIT